ncbi:MAG: esterase/lipase family protein [Candidatus Hodarchaeales archaeon]|jgi:hypothetical protein
MSDSDTGRVRVAFLIHGFAGKKGFMNEIEESLCKSPFKKIYNQIFNVSFYNSKHGLDFSRPYDLRTPIYDPSLSQNLAQFFFEIINKTLNKFQSTVYIDIYAHSMGGLVTRAMIKYIFPKDNHKLIIERVFLLGSPNHGTRLAKKFINIPTDILLTGLNLALELPRGGIKLSDWQILNSQFMQMVPKSEFLQRLNSPLTVLELSIKWYTIRGLNSSGLLESVWQPFLFRKIWINGNFPFLHIGIIPNDGVVDAESVPLKHAKNILVVEATHMNLLKWISNEAGAKVLKKLKGFILKT